MDKITTKTWVGLLINLLVMIVGVYSMGEKYQWDSFSTGFAVVALLAFLVSLAGVIMLACGKPAGGIVGAVGSAFFVPIGFICLIGCLQSRNNIRFAGYAPGAPAPSTPPVGQVSPAEETATGETVTGEAAAVETEHVEPAPDEKPLVAYPFRDERAQGCLTVILGIGLVVFLSINAALGLVAAGAVILIRGSLRMNTYVYALYTEYLECVPGLFSGSVRIPYTDILEAEVTSARACLCIKAATGREKVAVRFLMIPHGEREEARDAFAAKMRELGVLREQSATE